MKMRDFANGVKMRDFALTMRDFALKYRDFALQMLDFALQMRDFAIKLRNFALKMRDFAWSAKKRRLAEARKESYHRKRLCGELGRHLKPKNVNNKSK